MIVFKVKIKKIKLEVITNAGCARYSIGNPFSIWPKPDDCPVFIQSGKNIFIKAIDRKNQRIYSYQLNTNTIYTKTMLPIILKRFKQAYKHVKKDSVYFMFMNFINKIGYFSGLDAVVKKT